MKHFFGSSTFLFLGLFFSSILLKAQNNFYDPQVIQEIRIYFSQPDWDYRMDTAKAGADSYLMADSMLVNGVRLDSIGVQYKGNSSYDATYFKNPLHISLDEFAERDYLGITDFKLSNGYGDPSQIRECLSYGLLKNYMHCSEANFAKVFINDQYIGLYSNVENVGKKFCLNHFGSSDGIFIKGNPVVTPGPTTKSNLKFLNGTDSSAYFNYYEIKSDYGWNDLMRICDTISNNAAGLGSVMDIDRMIWILAFNNLMVNLDSYTGVFCQNYYLYKDEEGIYNPIIWDLNMSFGGFPYIGSGATGMGGLTVTNMVQLTPLAHQSDPFWPVLNAILNNSETKRMFIAHMKTISEEMLESGVYLSMAIQLRNLIDPSVMADTNCFFTYQQFIDAMSNVTNVGSYQVPGIAGLMGPRISYLQSTPEFSAAAPTINSTGISGNNPFPNSNFTLTADVSNAVSVNLYYRQTGSLHFKKASMFDDGSHSDGSAGDGIFGAEILMGANSIEYYVYAENANAGKFYPARAAHEFLTVEAQSSSGNQTVVINEIMASNTTTQADNFGEFDDWIELFNNGSSPVDLSGYYLTDNPLNLNKWEIPSGSVIPGNGFMIFWADEDSSQGWNHINFKLSGLGEEIYLVNPGLSIVDSVIFGAQTTDMGYARNPNGTGNFVIQSPTFNTFNSATGIEDKKGNSAFQFYPNPAEKILYIESSEPTLLNIYDALGQLISTKSINGKAILDLNHFNSGIYFLQAFETRHKLLIVK